MKWYVYRKENKEIGRKKPLLLARLRGWKLMYVTDFELSEDEC